MWEVPGPEVLAAGLEDIRISRNNIVSRVPVAFSGRQLQVLPRRPAPTASQKDPSTFQNFPQHLLTHRTANVRVNTLKEGKIDASV